MDNQSHPLPHQQSRQQRSPRISKLSSRERRALTTIPNRPSRTLMGLDGSTLLSNDELFRRAAPNGKVLRNGARRGGANIIEGFSRLTPSAGRDIIVHHSTYLRGGKYDGETLRALRAERGVGSKARIKRTPIASNDHLISDVSRTFPRQ